MLFVGTQTNDQDKRIEIDFDGLLHHTLIAGQSGSGKSFLVARLIEEILVRTRARILIVDPNGDFRRMSIPSADVWIKFAEAFQKLNTLTINSKIDSFDQKETFQAGWKKRRFIYLSPGLANPVTIDDAISHRLVIHWDSLGDDQRNFLLNASSSTEPRIFLGLKAVAENARWVTQHRPDVRIKMDLRGLLEVAKQFAESHIGMREYEYAKILTRDDWYAVHAKIDDLLSQYSIWWSAPDRVVARPPGLADFIDGSFESNPKLVTYWDALVLSLEASPPADALLSADVALSRLWLRAKSEWRNREEYLRDDATKPDKRVPTFIIVDEAHNFAPDISTDPLRSRVTARLMQIASEGRKYGLYLILATQRPTKLHRELVAECENACVLRLQSKIETDFAVKVLGLSDAEAHAVPTFTKGQGVFFGRWVGGTAQMNTKIAPARIVVGGGELGAAWKTIPDTTPELAGEVSSITEFVQGALGDSDGPVDLARLAGQIRNRFGEEETLHWFGHYTFKEFIASLGIENLQFASTPPGYVYLEGVHEPPTVNKKSSEVASLTLEAELPDASMADTVVLLKRALNMPLASKLAYKYLFEAASEEIQVNEFNLTDTSKAIRDRCISRGHPVGRSVINFVLKGVSLSGHKFDRDLPQSPNVLAEGFVKSLLFALRKNGMAITESLEHKIRAFFSGGILNSEIMSEPPLPNPGAENRRPISNLTDVPLEAKPIES